MNTVTFTGADDRTDISAEISGVAVSMHVCGSWVRAMLRGQLDWNSLPEVRIVAGRVQVNTHAEEHI